MQEACNKGIKAARVASLLLTDHFTKKFAQSTYFHLRVGLQTGMKISRKCFHSFCPIKAHHFRPSWHVCMPCQVQAPLASMELVNLFTWWCTIKVIARMPSYESQFFRMTSKLAHLLRNNLTLRPVGTSVGIQTKIFNFKKRDLVWIHWWVHAIRPMAKCKLQKPS